MRTISKIEKAPDPVIREVRATKERLALCFGYDIRKIAAQIRENQKKYGNRVVSRENDAR